ncbi:hypothetical protein M3Y96_01124900 [Aphelenchoides besseyi]|nr:hypothetical protein M3Y96_01124900 [Aphelenchoides besseyi]
MAIGTVLENLSNRKLFAILLTLVGLQAVFIILGAVMAPPPSSSMEFLMTRCQDKTAGKTSEWFFIRPQGHCNIIHELSEYRPVSDDVRDIVFQAQMPHARNGQTLEYSPWFQFLLGLLDVEIAYDSKYELKESIHIQLDIRMGYRTNDDDSSVWHEFISTTIDRELTCTIDKDKRFDGNTYNCSTIDLFELGANNYPFYLLNIRLPVNRTVCRTNPSGPNCALGMIKEMRVIAIHQNGGFTAIWLWMKTLITPLVILVTRWYYKRMTMLNRKRFLIEKCILALGISLAVLDLPIEWISLWLRMPFMLLISDVRQGIFYAVLFSFWLVYAGEHLLDNRSRNSLRNYSVTLTLVVGACVSLLLYDLFERGVQLSNPFHSIWSTETGRHFAYGTLYIATACSAIYFVFLLYKVMRAWSTIKQKRATRLQHSSELSRLKAENVIYRFKFLMLFTVTCALFTLISYWLKQASFFDLFRFLVRMQDAFIKKMKRFGEYGEGQLHGDDYEESSWMSSSTSAFFTGTFGMWNIYVLLLMSMYAPSHKHYNGHHVLEDENADLTDMGTESSPLTTFLKHSGD